MHKRLMILFCALIMIAVAMPAFAAVQNVKVSGDITANYINRNEFSLSKGSTTAGLTDRDSHINNFLSQTRIRIDADLTDNVSTVVRLINERTWGNVDDDATSTDIDLDLAYVTMKEFFYSPLTITLGRQELHFGNDFIIGDSTTNRTANYTEAGGFGSVNGDLSLRKSFDAIRATLNYDPLVIDVVYAIVQRNTTNGSANDGQALAGINAGYKMKDKWNSMIEGYFWSNVNANQGVTAIPGIVRTGKKTDKVYTLGLRGSTNPLSKLNLQQEIAWQSGTYNSYDGTTSIAKPRSAFAMQSMATVTPGWKYEPTMGLVYSYFSGDRNPVDQTTGKAYHGWNPMFENQTAGHIINALFSATNCHDINLKASIKPMEDVKLTFDYVYLMLAKNHLDNVAANRTVANDYGNIVLAGGSKSNDLGQEFDTNMTYDYTEDVQFGLLTGMFIPGQAIAKDTTQSREIATEAIASCKVSF